MIQRILQLIKRKVVAYEPLMLYYAVAISVMMDLIFLPMAAIYSPMVVEWIFVMELYAKLFMAIVYLVHVSHNMIHNIQLCHFTIYQWQMVKNESEVSLCCNDLIFKQVLYCHFLNTYGI